MDIKDFTDIEKSVILAKLCGWEVREEDTRAGIRIWIKASNYRHATTDLYKPEFMALAWQVLNWAWYKIITVRNSKNTLTHMDSMMFYITEFCMGNDDLFAMASEEAQRRWLDEILKLSIEQGLIEAE